MICRLPSPFNGLPHLPGIGNSKWVHCEKIVETKCGYEKCPSGSERPSGPRVPPGRAGALGLGRPGSAGQPGQAGQPASSNCDHSNWISVSRAKLYATKGEHLSMRLYAALTIG